MNSDDFNQVLEDAWLNIHVREDTLFNPLQNIPEYLRDEPHKFILWLMQRPEYFSFLCKHLMGIELLPFQCVILQELWKRKFPMLIGSRGLGKSFLLAVYALIRILLYPQRKVIICGASFRQSKVIFNYMESIWYSSTLLRDICRGSEGVRHEPDMYRLHIGDSVASSLPIGDGCGLGETFITYNDGFGRLDRFGNNSLKRNTIIWGKDSFNYSDEAYYNGIRDVKKITTNKGFSFGGTNNHKLKVLDGIDIKWKRLDEIKVGDYIPIDRSYRWHNGDYTCCDHEILRETRLNELSSNMLSANRKTMSKYLSRLFNDFGNTKYQNNHSNINLNHHSVKLLEQIQQILLHYSIISSLDRKHNTLTISGPYIILFNQEIRSFDYIKLSVPNNNYSLLYYDQVKSVEDIGKFDTYDLHVPDLHYYTASGFISHNSKIRGQRANDILSDEFAAQSEEIFENVIAGFAAVKSSPAESVKEYAADDVKRKFGKKVYAEQDDVNLDNQLILSGTAYYDFNHFAKYWKRWRSIIRSKGDNNKLTEIFGGIDEVPRDFNWKDYSIIRLPYDLLPKGFMDDNMVARSKATVHSGIYMMEFGSCVLHDTQIITNNGLKCIKDINIGDKVLTHKGRFKNVTRLYRRPYKNKICVIEFENGEQLKITPEHPILQDNDQFVPIKDIIDKTYTSSSSYYIYNKYLEDHDGFVYNLDIEDDHSYSTPCCTIHNCFSNDSNGFFKRSLIESCVISKDNEIELPSGKVYFTPQLKGSHNKQYVYGIDPASEVDNFSIVVLEHGADHRKIVHVWTTTKSEHRERIKAGLTSETDFYSYCARKIRDLMKVFPCIRIALDAQGGGISICEALHDHDKIQENELPIWPVIDPEKPADTDGESGLHLIELIQFASSDWTSEANHGLRKDFEDKVCLFPFFDNISLGMAQIEDENGRRLYDTLEDCYMEIEELKNELSTIVITQTASGRDRWDTPEVKLPGNKKGRLRKDRYSSLLMANMVSRKIVRNPDRQFITSTGGFAHSAKSAGDGRDYVGADWLARGLSNIY